MTKHRTAKGGKAEHVTISRFWGAHIERHLRHDLKILRNREKAALLRQVSPARGDKPRREGGMSDGE